ncbi:MAG: tetratricopeptide repeat protein [Chitinophagaceae bacterium]
MYDLFYSLVKERSFSPLHLFKLGCFIFFVFILNFHSKAQYIPITDTVEYAKEKAYEKNFGEADRILTEFNNSSPDLNSFRLHARVLFWMKDFDRSKVVHQKALAAFPEENILKLEYGIFLFDIGKYKLSASFLEDYIVSDSSNNEALTRLAYMHLWNGRTETSKKYAKTILKLDPENVEATEILKQVHNYTSPYVQINAGVFSDDQPLNSNFRELVTGWYRSWILSPVISVKHNAATVSNNSYSSTWLQLMNSININMGITTISLKGGVFNQGKAFTTGAVYLNQKLSKDFSLFTGVERRPYQYTISSIKQPLIQDFYTISLNYNLKDKWLGKAAYELQQFDDNNRIHTTYLWMLLPLLHKGNFSFKGGYGYNYSTSLLNRFILKDSSTSNRNFPLSTKQTEGIYDPYFTPQNQIVHSILASVNIKTSDKFFISLRSSIGVSAKADAPSFTVKEQNNQYSVHKSYSVLAYTPVEAVAEMIFLISPRFTIKSSYTYNSLFFYTSHSGVLGLKYSFIP